MKVVALLMAGGEGRRMGREKQLIALGGKRIIDRVIESLLDSRYVDRIYIAVSRKARETWDYTKGIGHPIVETRGNGFVEDMREAIKKVGGRHVLVIGSDLPLIRPEDIDMVIEEYFKRGRPCLSVFMKEGALRALGLEPGPEMIYEVGGEACVPSCINIIDASRIEDREIEQADLLVEDPCFLNVNSESELEVARRLVEHDPDPLSRSNRS